MQSSSSIVTIDLTRHPQNEPLGLLLAPGAGGVSGGPSTMNNHKPNAIFGNHNTATSSSSSSSSSLPTSSTVILVAGWEHDNKFTHNNLLGPIQRSGLVRLGDRLVRINGKDITSWTFREVMDALKELRTDDDTNNNNNNNRNRRKRRLKTLGFAPAGTIEWSKGNHNAAQQQQHTTSSSESTFFGLFNNGNVNNTNGQQQQQHVVHSKRTYSFTSYINGWKVAYDESSEKKQEEKVQKKEDERLQHTTYRQPSDNSTSELEEQLMKEPTIRYDDSAAPITETTLDDCNNEGNNNSNREEEEQTTSIKKRQKSSYIQYEITCHLSFHNPSSQYFQSSSSLHSSPNNDDGNHYTWSVYKRYSELLTLHETLRYDFGWLMDSYYDDDHDTNNNNNNNIRNDTIATNTNNNSGGIVFPSSHGIESWWYGRSGGSAGKGILSSLFGAHKDDDEVDNKDCPYPISFIQRRQSELSTYWNTLMKIQDIFEFSNVESHKYGKVMASFLGVDKILEARQLQQHNDYGGGSISGSMRGASSTTLMMNGQQQQQQQHSSMAAIHENEASETMFGSSHLRPSLLSNESNNFSTPTREISGLTIHDDDVSILSDGTGAFGGPHDAHVVSPIRHGGRPVVDVVPKHYSSPSLNVGDGYNNTVTTTPTTTFEKRVPTSSSSVASSSSVLSKNNKRRSIAAPKAKPAFQRQFLTP